MNAPRCRAGDLAIVINATIAENIGNIVEVLGPPTGVPFPSPWACATWQVRTVSGRETLVYKRGRRTRLERHAEGPVPDFRLRPLPKVVDMDELERFVEAPAPVETRIAVEMS